MSDHTNEDIERAAARFEKWADGLDPDQLEDIGDLRHVAELAETASTIDARLREAVELARAHGHSWNRIAIALGVSRQAARQRFTDKIPARN